METLQDKVVLLTGGSRGLGPNIAQALVIKGARIVLVARSRSTLQEVTTQLGGHAGNVQFMTVDLRQPSEREELVTQLLMKFGKIDILINNAGLETEGAFIEQPWCAIEETIEVNLLAPMALTRLVLPGMLERKTGHIVNIASVTAKTGAPYAAVYSGSKAGLSEWTRALRLELQGTGVHFSTIFPRYVREVGMFAKFGMKSPWIIGSCAPNQVAEAVVIAIERGRKEQVVNFPPLRYSFVINEISPTVGDWLMRLSGTVDFQHRKVGK